MVDLLKYKAWALNESYYTRMYTHIADRVRLGHSLEDLIKKKSQDDLIPFMQALADVVDAHPPVHADALSVNVERDQQSGLPIVRSGSKNIALISIVGPLTKYGDLCSMGMKDYQNLITKVNNSSSIDGLVIIMDTPGGTVDGTPELGLAIKMSTKPVGVFGDNMVASAGLWLASQASVIVGNKNNPTEFGSIGVLMALPNYQNVIDAGNLPKMTIYRAEQSSEKALVNALEPISAEAETQLQQDLNAIADQFISTVKAGRGEVLNTDTPGLFNGKMFDIYDAKKAGLIDSIGTLQTAINKVADLARQKQNGNTPRMGNAKIDNMKFPKISALFGKSGKEANAAQAAEQESLATDQASMEAAEKKLADMEAEAVTLKAEKDAAVERATKAEATATELTAQVTTLNAEKETLTATVASQKAELEKKPTGNLTTVITDPNKESEQANDNGTPKANSYETSMDKEAAEIRKANATNQIFK